MAPAAEVTISELAAAAAAGAATGPGFRLLKPGHSVQDERSIDISSRCRILKSVCKKTTAIGPTTNADRPEGLDAAEDAEQGQQRVQLRLAVQHQRLDHVVGRRK